MNIKIYQHILNTVNTKMNLYKVFFLNLPQYVIAAKLTYC